MSARVCPGFGNRECFRVLTIRNLCSACQKRKERSNANNKPPLSSTAPKVTPPQSRLDMADTSVEKVSPRQRRPVTRREQNSAKETHVDLLYRTFCATIQENPELLRPLFTKMAQLFRHVGQPEQEPAPPEEEEEPAPPGPCLDMLEEMASSTARPRSPSPATRNTTRRRRASTRKRKYEEEEAASHDSRDVQEFLKYAKTRRKRRRITRAPVSPPIESMIQFAEEASVKAMEEEEEDDDDDDASLATRTSHKKYRITVRSEVSKDPSRATAEWTVRRKDNEERWNLGSADTVPEWILKILKEGENYQKLNLGSKKKSEADIIPEIYTADIDEALFSSAGPLHRLTNPSARPATDHFKINRQLPSITTGMRVQIEQIARATAIVANQAATATQNTAVDDYDDIDV